MKKLLLIAGACILLSGCVVNSKDDFYTGVYSSKNGEILLNEDNTFSYELADGNTGKGTYTVSDDEVTLTENDKHYYLNTRYRSITYIAEKSDKLFSDDEKLTLPASAEGDNVYMSSGDTFDFSTISPNIVNIKLTSYSKKNNVKDVNEVKDTILILRDSGLVTTFTISSTSLRVVSTDGADEAKVEAKMRDGSTKEYNIFYDCNCER